MPKHKSTYSCYLEFDLTLAKFWNDHSPKNIAFKHHAAMTEGSPTKILHMDF